MNFRRRHLIYLIPLAILFVGLRAATAFGQTATPTPEPALEADLDARVDAILNQLSVEEKIGQLFMIDFVGQYLYRADTVGQLIDEYKIGAVYLTEANNNIDNSLENTFLQVAELNNRLQTRIYTATLHETSDGAFFLPLFIAVDHEGDGFPNVRLRNGFTPIPSAMALGATWNPDDVEAVGAIIGEELAAVGVNMLLGPVVDVLERPHPEGSGDINIRAFGGSPDWVGLLGRAYVRGVHRGSEGRVLTVAKHFPGHGASDRSPDLEVATVQKSFTELQGSDLVPFFAVTRPDPDDPLGVTDGLMPSHIRYRGFQGDIGQLTFPISLDPEGMSEFMALSPLTEWRQEGLVVCDSLGVEAVKSFYDPTFETFPAKQIAKDALMAGNDVLPVVSYAQGVQPNWFLDTVPTITETITFFQEQYREDEVFRARADDAVRHILRAKLRLYPNLSLDEVLVPTGEPLGQRDQVVAKVARDALTLLYPDPEKVPAPPRSDEEILIIGCFGDCFPRPRLQGETVRDALLGLYGPGGSGLIDPERVQLLSFKHLYQFMNDELEETEIEPVEGEAEPAPTQEPKTEEEVITAQIIVERVESADWILLVLINYMPDDVPESAAARAFLRDPRFDLRDKKVVALALHAPYYLDATEISKLSAYYAVYSKVDPSLKVALRALFKDVTPTVTSAPPVSVEGIGYNLATALRPDPGQTLKLTLEKETEAQAEAESADDAWRVGDQVRVSVGPILDCNGHPVADGTLVYFRGHYSDQDIILSPREASTTDGVAWAVFRPNLPGRLEISVDVDSLEAVPVNLEIAPLASADEPVTITAPSTTINAPTPSTTSPTTFTPTDTPLENGGGGVSPFYAALIFVGVLLIIGPLVFLWYRGRAAAPTTPAAPVANADDATATVSADLGALSPTLTGRTLGSCQVLEKIGEGGMGQVYRGHHPMLDRSVAIKILPPVLVQSEEMRARFLQEARIAAALRHPNIVHIYDFGEDEGLIYMTMEYVAGSSLKTRLNELRAAGEVMPVAEAVDIASQIARALAYAHAQDAVHRDLKPPNILLTEDGQAILLDFGLAVLKGGPRYTEPGKVWGSPTYIAPEQLGEPPNVDARSDIYALGVLLYEMVTGCPPFQAESLMEVLWQQANVAPRPPRELAPDISPSLDAIILKALAKNPAERFQTSREMAQALHGVSGL